MKFGKGMYTKSRLKIFNLCVLVKVCGLNQPQTFVHKIMNILFPQSAWNIFIRHKYIVSFCTSNQATARRPSVAEVTGPLAGQFVLADQVTEGQVPSPQYLCFLLSVSFHQLSSVIHPFITNLYKLNKRQRF
jgi:hypothetical protein